MLEMRGLSRASKLMWPDELAALLAVKPKGLTSTTPLSQLQGLLDPDSASLIGAVDSQRHHVSPWINGSDGSLTP
jgi:hypothetical protein